MLNLSSTTLPLLALSIAVALGVYKLIVYPLFFHPLKNIPRAHWTVPFPYIGSVWILVKRYQNRGNATTLRAHQINGTVVRVAYNELSVNCVDNGIRTIYGGGWEKHEWYPRQFGSYGVIPMFSSIHHTPHSQKKRTMANIYSKSNLQVSPQLKSNSHLLLTTRFLPLLQSISDSGESVDVHEINNSFTMDFMSAYLFGLGQATNFTQDTKTRRKVLHEYHSRRDYEWHSAEVSTNVRRMLKIFRIPFVPGWVAEANRYLEGWNTSMCAAADKFVDANPSGASEDNAGNEPVVYRHFRTGMAKLRLKDPDAGRDNLPHITDLRSLLATEEGRKKVAKWELFSEMNDHLGAGHETSAIALTYLYWEFCKQPSLQDRLRVEVLGLSPQLRWPPSEKYDLTKLELPGPKTIDSLPYLNAVVMEVLRLHAPIPGIEPRVSPYVAGGSKLGSFDGIPGGVRVSSMPYALHRHPEVFPEPERFDPDRWLTNDEDKLKEMYRWFWAFGSGGRMCIGSHLAVQEIKLLVAAIYTNWTTSIVDDEGIEELDTYTTRPVSNKLILKLTHRP